MMKKALKLVGLFFVLVVISAGIAIIPIGYGENLHEGRGDYPENSGIIDEADIFDRSEEKELTAFIKETADDLDMNILVLLNSRYMSDEDTEIRAHELYDETFGEYTDGVLLLLDLSGGYDAYDFISTSGKAHLRYQKVIDPLFDTFYNHLPKSGSAVDPEQIKLAVEDFCYGLDTVEGEPGLLTYYRDKDAEKPTYTFRMSGEVYVTTRKAPGVRFKFAITGSLVGILLALGLYSLIKSNYKFKNKTSPSIYVVRNKTKYNEYSDTFIRSYTTKTRIQSSSGGSRGGFGGGGHSGSHGGGGRHR